MKLPLAKYAGVELVIMLVISGIMGVFVFTIYPILLIIPVALFGFTIYFFRDPKRNIPEGNELIVSPADGTVIEIRDVNENTFIKEPATEIAIFLSVFNVHINRAPCAGKVIMLDYRKGKFLVASNPEASNQNECNSIGLVTTSGFRILTCQIAGIIAQRIVCDLQLNQEVKKGESIGMIKFGSRTEIYIPKSKLQTINVKVNDLVKGGETILGTVSQ